MTILAPRWGIFRKSWHTIRLAAESPVILTHWHPWHTLKHFRVTSFSTHPTHPTHTASRCVHETSALYVTVRLTSTWQSVALIINRFINCLTPPPPASPLVHWNLQLTTGESDCNWRITLDWPIAMKFHANRQFEMKSINQMKLWAQFKIGAFKSPARARQSNQTWTIKIANRMPQIKWKAINCNRQLKCNYSRKKKY